MTKPMVRHSCLLLTLLFLGFLSRQAAAVTITQAAGSQSVAWEAEDTYAISNSDPTRWIAKSDPTASGTTALYQSGVNKTDVSSSYASYAIKFSTPGTYTLYLRWRADAAFTTQDPNSANSYRPAISFGDLASDAANFPVSSVNNSRVPPDVNNYKTDKEGAATYTVTQADVDSGAPLILKIGTREAGMFIDRFALSLNDSLTEADVNGLANSETDLIIQNPNDNFLAFEAERVSQVVNVSAAPPTVWMVKNDPTASGTQALYQNGVNKTDISSSFALYTLKFRTPGTYTLYLRWRADAAFTTQDPNSANSYRPPISLGDLAVDAANFPVSSVNNSRVPPDVNNYKADKEGAATYEVTQSDIDSGQPLIFKVGTREAGMFIDRFAFSLNDSLSEADFNLLPNSGSAARPALLKAVGSSSLTKVTLSFDRAIKPDSLAASKFTIAGLTVTDAALDPNTAKDVILTTSAQTPGTKYEVVVNGVTDVNGNPVSPNSKISFTAWKLSSGWVLREIYNVAGTTVADLQASPKFPDRPDQVDYIRSMAILKDLQVNDYGARLTTLFVPPAAGPWEFFLYADDDAQLLLSSDESEANLQLVLQSVAGETAFSTGTMFTSENLSVGKRYLLQVLFKQSSGDAKVAVAARAAGSAGDPAGLAPLGGSLVAYYTNPDAGAINITRQPSSVTTTAFSRATFRVQAESPSGGNLFYQWQVDGTDIPGATRQAYSTPVLSTADSGKKYRVIVSANGNSVPSADATLTVNAGQPSNLQPYIGINFVGGGNNSPGAALDPWDVAGVVQQENFNNVYGSTIQDVPLSDAAGNATPVTISVEAAVTIGDGAGESDADHAMFQGYIHNNNAPLNLTLNNVPDGNYDVIVYSLGFNFNSTYEEDATLASGASVPLGGLIAQTYTVKADDVSTYLKNPVFKRMQSQLPIARDSGNYIEWENVRPAPDGTLSLSMVPQSSNTGVTYLPPVNAIQLIKVLPPTTLPSITVTRQGGTVTIAWGDDAKGFELDSTAAVGPGANWLPVSGVPNPIQGAGSFNASTAGKSATFYRLKK